MKQRSTLPCATLVAAVLALPKATAGRPAPAHLPNPATAD